MSDPQDQAEALDQDVVDPVDDRTGDDVGEDLPQYPPERYEGVTAFGVTAVEEDAGESFAQRDRDTEPEVWEEPLEDSSYGAVGQLVDGSATTLDEEEELVADVEPGLDPSAEEAAMHIEPER